MFVDGIIIKGIGGFYYAEAAGSVYECKARGTFRKEGITPLAGDNVRVALGQNGDENVIDEIYERKSVLKRPPVANIDRLFIVTSVCDPSPNTLLIDRLTAIAENKGIEPVIVITKADLGDPSALLKTYTLAGIKTICTEKSGLNTDEVKKELSGHISAFTGNSGVGKSTLLNNIDSSLNIETGEISRKLGRGRHTTRSVELYKICGGYVADTPGFSSLEIDIEQSEFISKDDLPFCFGEFAPYLGSCKFSTCTHCNDLGCKIVEAVKKGEISESRHESYKALYNEAKYIKDWQLK
ncbi:MAG: ribosome small subunit-dependent GTPase A [Clostridiales bacterium]|nr:ribosome small subunit-dependent GTPase A [Clostridiales bacterium]